MGKMAVRKSRSLLFDTITILLRHNFDYATLTFTTLMDLYLSVYLKMVIIGNLIMIILIIMVMIIIFSKFRKMFGPFTGSRINDRARLFVW